MALAPFCAQAAITFTGDTFVDPDNVASIGITGVGSAAVVPPRRIASPLSSSVLGARAP
jgi:hypothetical protein